MKVATKNKIRLYWEYYKYYSFFGWGIFVILQVLFLIIPFCVTGVVSHKESAAILMLFVISFFNYAIGVVLLFASLYPWDIKEKYFYKWLPFEPEK